MYLETDSPINVGSGSGYGNGLFGNDGIWAIILFALIFGYGRNGFGGYGYGAGSGVGENYVLATDFATIERKLDGVNNGLCDGFYAMNTGMLNGFAGVQNTLTQGFAGLNQNIVTQGYESRLATEGLSSQIASSAQGLSSQIASCCCDLRSGLADLKYTMASDTCSIKQSIADSTNAVIGWLTNEKISSLQAENAGLKAQISNDKQSAYIVNELRPCPRPAYITCNPYQSYGYGTGTCSTL